MDQEINTLKTQRKGTPHHIDVGELPPEQQFKKLATASKHLVDTIKMVAYRAETAMANILRGHQFRSDEARQLPALTHNRRLHTIPFSLGCYWA
jgi:hypothetical protein